MGIVETTVDMLSNEFAQFLRILRSKIEQVEELERVQYTGQITEDNWKLALKADDTLTDLWNEIDNKIEELENEQS